MSSLLHLFCQVDDFCQQCLPAFQARAIGYISKPLHDLLFERGVELITKLRKNMASRSLPQADNLLLRKRAIIETIIDQLKNISLVEHSRHRAPCGFLWDLAAGLIAYCHQPKKPSLHLRDAVALTTP